MCVCGGGGVESEFGILQPGWLTLMMMMTMVGLKYYSHVWLDQ